MKLSYTDGQMSIVSENPDDRIHGDMAFRFKQAIAEELRQCLEEGNVALRNIQPGQTIVLKSRPIEITITREPELEPAITETPAPVAPD